MKAFVTGATGFIGSHLAGALVDAGYEVACLTRSRSSTERLKPLNVELVHGDVQDVDSLKSAFRGADVVFHLAGLTKSLDNSEMLRINATGAGNVAEACAAQANPPTLVAVSSLAAAGPAPNGRPRVEADPVRPTSDYGRSKRAGELAVAKFAAQAPISIARPPIVFGEGDKDMLGMYRPIKWLGVSPEPWRNDRRMSMIHAADLSAGLIAVAQSGRRIAPTGLEEDKEAAGVYFLAAQKQPTYAEWGRLIAQSLGRRRFRPLPAPDFVMWAAAGLADAWAYIRRRRGIFNIDKVREATAGSWTCSGDRARAELGFEVKATLEDRFAETTRWYKNERWV